MEKAKEDKCYYLSDDGWRAFDEPQEGMGDLYSYAEFVAASRPDLEVERAAKLAELSAAHEAAVNAGFIANILGHDVHYRSNRDDQRRFTRGAANVNGAVIWEGESATRHTQAQCQKLCEYFDTHIDSMTEKYAGLFSAAKNVTQGNQSDFDTIVWGNDDLVKYPLEG